MRRKGLVLELIVMGPLMLLVSGLPLLTAICIGMGESLSRVARSAVSVLAFATCLFMAGCAIPRPLMRASSAVDEAWNVLDSHKGLCYRRPRCRHANRTRAADLLNSTKPLMMICGLSSVILCAGQGLLTSLQATLHIKGLLEMMFDVLSGWIDEFIRDMEVVFSFSAVT